MKKIQCFLGVVLILLLSACGNSIPNGMSETYYNFGIKAVEAADKYLDFEISEDDVFFEFERLSSTAKNLPDAGDNIKDDLVYTAFLSLTLQVTDLGGRTDYDDVLAARNSLAKRLNLKER